MTQTDVLRLGVFSAAAAVFFLAPSDYAPAAALTVLTVGLFATSALPEPVTALLFFALAVVFAVAPPAAIFSGFAAGALWLVFGGILIGAAVKETGLGKRIANLLLTRLKGGYLSTLIGIVVAATALGFVMPSTMARTLLLVPVVLALADALGLEEGRNGRIGLVAATCLASYMGPVGILPANVPNNVLIGAAEAYHGLVLGWLDYFILHFPTLSIGRCVLLVIAIRVMFPDEIGSREETSQSTSKPWSMDEKKLGLILAIALVFWMTDSFHGVRPGWVALAAGLACILPGIGVLKGDVFQGRLALGPFFYVAGILGVGALVVDSGLGDALSKGMISLVPIGPGEDVANFTFLSAIGAAIAAVATMPGMPAILTPAMPEIATVTALPLETVLMTQVVGYSTLILPYQVPPVVVGLQLAGIGQAAIARITLVLLVPTVLILWPLTYGWWQVMGLFG